MTPARDWGIRKRLTLAFLGVLVPYVGLAALGAAGFHSLWQRVHAIRQVVTNLVSNAIKYSPPNRSIAIQMRHDGGALEWAIQDSGIGVPKAEQGRLFEKFFRAENAATTVTDGTGLGLYLVRLIVERFGGRVWCGSEEGQGARFTFTLPLAGRTS